MTESGSSSTDRPTFTVRVFGLLLGKAHSVVTGRDLQVAYISMYFLLGKVGQLDSWSIGQLDSWSISQLDSWLISCY